MSSVRVPSGFRDFFSPCGPISFQGLTPRSYYLEYLLEQFNLPYLNHYIIFAKDSSCRRADLPSGKFIEINVVKEQEYIIKVFYVTSTVIRSIFRAAKFEHV